MNSYSDRAHPFAYFCMCLLTIPLIGLFSNEMYKTIRLDFFYTKEISAKILNWKVYNSKGVSYSIDYTFELKEHKNIIVTGQSYLDYEEFENSKMSSNIQIVYLVSNPEINRPIIKMKDIWIYVRSILIILICLPVAIIGIFGLFNFAFTKKINKSNQFNATL
jgi:hypothetical protein